MWTNTACRIERAMFSPRRWFVGGVCGLAVSLAAVAGPQTRSVSGVVENLDGKRVPNIEVRVTNVGGTVSSDSGEFAIPLIASFNPGDAIELSVPDAWVIISPWEGRTFVPRRGADTIHVRVARKGDSAVLANPQVVEKIVAGVTSQLEPKLPVRVQPDEYLAEKAKILGFSVDQLKSAIDDWSKRVQGPYQKGLAALYAQRYTEARQYIEQSISSSETDLVEKYVSLATAESQLGHYPQSEAALTRARAIQGQNSTVLNDLGMVLVEEGRYAEAEPLYERALAIREKELGTQDPEVAAVLNNLAVLFSAQGRYARAEGLYKRALAIAEKTLAPEDLRVATLLNNLAEFYYEQGRYIEAEPLFKRALTITEKVLGPRCPYVAMLLNNMAELRRAQGYYTEGELLCKRALTLDEQVFGPNHPNVATDLNTLALIYKEEGKNADAEPLYKRALAIDDAILGPHHPTVAVRLNNLAGLYSAQGRYREAESLYRRALAIDEEALGPEHPRVADIADHLAQCLRKLGRNAEAKIYEDQAARIRAKLS